MPLHRIFFSLLLLFLPTQPGYHFWPEWASVLGRRVDYLSPTVYFTDILLALTMASWVFSKKSKIQIKSQKFATLLFIVLFIFFNIFFAANQPVAVYKWLKAMEFIALGFYIIKTKPQFPFIIHHLSFGILYSSLIAIGQFMMQRSVGGPLWWLGERSFTAETPGIAKIQSCQLSAISCQLFLRPYATFPHPNVLGGYIAAILPLVIIQFFNNPIIKLSNTKKIFYFATFILGAIALALTFSRSAIVVGAMGILVTILHIKNQKSNIKNTNQRSKILQTVFVIGFLFFLSFITYRVLPLDQTSESVVVRGQLNNAAIKLWQQFPLFGVGLGNFLVELPKALPSRTVYFLQPVHNIYLLALSELGIVGVVFIAYLVFREIKILELRGKNYHKNKNHIPLFLIHYSLFTIFLLGLVDHYPLTLQQGQLLLTIFLSLSLSRDT